MKIKPKEGRGTGRGLPVGAKGKDLGGVPGALSRSGEWCSGKQAGVGAAQSERSATSGVRHQGMPVGFTEGPTERGPRLSRCPPPAPRPRRPSAQCPVRHRPLLPAPIISPSTELRRGEAGNRAQRPSSLLRPNMRAQDFGNAARLRGAERGRETTLTPGPSRRRPGTLGSPCLVGSRFTVVHRQGRQERVVDLEPGRFCSAGLAGLEAA